VRRLQYQTASRPAKSDRRVAHHRERQATRAALQVSDLEAALTPPSVHNNAAPLSERPVEAKDRRSRHQKPPFWKRSRKVHHGAAGTSLD
jgi:hypothetical protein